MMTESTEEQNLENNQSRSSDLQAEEVDNVKANKAESDRMALIRGMVISPWVSLGAILLAALVYPCIRGSIPKKINARKSLGVKSVFIFVNP
jgi:hypothetical protein